MTSEIFLSINLPIDVENTVVDLVDSDCPNHHCLFRHLALVDVVLDHLAIAEREEDHLVDIVLYIVHCLANHLLI